MKQSGELATRGRALDRTSSALAIPTKENENYGSERVTIDEGETVGCGSWQLITTLDKMKRLSGESGSALENGVDVESPLQNGSTSTDEEKGPGSSPDEFIFHLEDATEASRKTEDDAIPNNLPSWDCGKEEGVDEKRSERLDSVMKCFQKYYEKHINPLMHEMKKSSESGGSGMFTWLRSSFSKS